MAQAGNIIASLQLRVDNFRRGMQDARSELTSFSDTTRSVAAGAGKALGAIGVAAGAALTAVGVGAVKAAADAESQLAAMETAFQGNTAKAKEYVKWAQEFGKTTPFEAKDVVDATIKLKAYGMDSKKVLGSVGDMAAGMGKGLNDAVEAVADAQTGELERLKEFGITKQMLIDKAAAMGKGEIVNAKGQITNQAALNDALLALMNQRFAGGMEKQSKTFNGQMSTLQDNWTNFLVAIGNEIMVYLKPALVKLNEWLGTIDFKKVAAQAAEFVKTLVEGFISVGKAIFAVFQFYKEHETLLNSLAAVIAGVVIPSLLGFILHAGVLKAKALWGLITSTLRMIATNYALGLSYLAAYAPIILIIAGIALLVAAIIWVVKHWDLVKSVTIAVWEAIKAFLAASWEWIKSAFSATMTWLSNLWTTVWNAIKAFFTAIWNGIVAVAVAIWNGLKAAFMFVFNAIKLYFTTVLNFYKTIFMAVWNAIKAVGIAIWNGLKAAFMIVFNAIKTYFTTVLNFYKTLFTTVWNAIKTAAIAVWNGLKTAATTTFNAIKTFFTTWLNTLKNAFTTVWNAVKTSVVAVWNGIKSSATTVWNGIKSAITTVVNGIKNTISTVFNTIKTVATNVWSGIRSTISSMMDGIRSKVGSGADFLRNTFTNAVSAVKSVFSGLWSSIRGSLENVVSGIKAKVTKAKEFLTELNPFKRHSPSLVDNVLAGTKIIRKTYEGLGGMDIKPPNIGSLSAGRVDLQETFGGGGTGGSGSGSTYNAPLIQVANMHVRNDQDARNVSRELFGLQRSHDRAKGGR